MLPPVTTGGLAKDASGVGGGVASAGVRAGEVLAGVPGAPANVDITIPGMLLDAQRDYYDEMYQNLMAMGAQLHVLGVLAGVVDGPTDEYRAAVAEAAGTYFEGLVQRSQRQHWSDYVGLGDAATIGMGLYYEGLGRFTKWAVPDDWETVEGVADGWTSTGETLQTTDPDKFIGNMGADFLKSIWNDCVKRYEEFWADVEAKGMLSAFAQLKADADFLAAQIAIDVALTIATGGAAAAVRIVASRISRTVSRVVIRVIDVATDAIPDAGVLKRIDLPDSQMDDKIKRQVLDEESLRTASERQDLSDRADVDNPDVERPDGKDGPEAPRKTDEWPDGSYRNPADAEGIRRTSDGEAMIQNKEGTWRPVSEMADPDADLPSGRLDDGRRHNPHVGRWGEVEADRYAASQRWERIDGSPTKMTDDFTGRNRIDAIYKDPGPPPRIIVSDAKALGSKLSTPKGKPKQMSREWIEARFKNSNLSRENLELLEDGYQSVVLKVDKNGKVTEQWLDADANNISAPSWRSQ